MKKNLLHILLATVLTVMTLSVMTVFASAATLPTKFWIEASETNGIPAKIDLFKAQTGGTNIYQLYIPGGVNTNDLSLSWDGDMQATVGGTSYASGTCPVPAVDTQTTYSFGSGTQATSFNLITYQGSTGVQKVFIDIDETQGTIAAMDGDTNHNTECVGRININGTWYEMPKIKGRGNATWSSSKDKKPYNVTLGKKITFPGVDYTATKKWSFLAEITDHSLLSNRSGYHLAHELGIGQDTTSADVWMNGEYQGCYTITPKTDSYVTKDGFMIEQDNYKEPAVANGGDPQFRLNELVSHVESNSWTSSYNFITVKKMGDNLLLNDGVVDESPENLTAVANGTIKPWLQDAWDAIRSQTGYNDKGKHYSEYIDVESFAKMYLIHEYIKSYDVCAGSILFYRDGMTDSDKLIAGPAWDHDNAMGSTCQNGYLGNADDRNHGDRRSGEGDFIQNISNYRTYGSEYKTSIYKTISKHSEFMEEVNLQYNKHRDFFDSLYDDVSQMATDITASAKMNHYKVEEREGQYVNVHKYDSNSNTIIGSGQYRQEYYPTKNSKSDWSNYKNNLLTFISTRSLWFHNKYYDPTYCDHTYEEEITQEPTCTEEGLATLTCSKCGDVQEDQPVPALGHDLNDEDGMCHRCDFAAPRAAITCSGGVSVTVYRTKNYDTVFAEDAAFGISRNGDTGEIDISGDGQINFKVNVEDGYELLSVTAEPATSYKNFKLPDELGENCYRVTKVKGDFDINVEARCLHDYEAVVTPPTCTEQGYTTHTCPRCGDSYVDEYVDALGHDWDAPTYTWSEDNSKVTAERICKNDDTHVETETVDTTPAVTKPATCEEKGETTYTAEFDNEAFETRVKTVADIDAIGHDYDMPMYIWSDDNSLVTATAVCKNDPDHIVSEQKETTSEVTKPATCEEAGNRKFTADFKNELFTVQTKDVEIPAIGHDWDDPTYTWSEDNSKVTAKRICNNDEAHVETETVDTNSEVTKPATCLEKGETTYTAEFENEAFVKQAKTLADIDALGHDWDAPTYEWAEDNSKVTAKRSCRNDPSHVETETAETSSEVTKPATCLEKGETTYTAEFENEAFVKQTKTLANIDALGHDWDAPTYEWAEDNSKVTANRVCKNDEAHVETETVDTTSEMTKPATCLENGETTYTAEFENVAFAKQSKTLDNIEPLGHDWEAPTYTWAEDNSKVTAKRICKNDEAHVETETVDTASAVTKPATCLEKGETTYSAEFENKAFAKQTKTEADIDVLGHDWDAPTYEWAEDNSKVTAKRICKNNESHVETETVDTASEVTKPATCLEKGETTYTAEFENEAFVKQAKTLADIDALGHDWNAPTYEWAEDNSKVTAKRICKNNESHVETETVDTASAVTKPATCLEKGETAYTAEFENEAFSKQTKTEADIEALGHDWDAPTYEWSEDNSKVTAKRICRNDPSHIETETVDTTTEVTKPATCLEKGETTYTAEFENEAFSKQTKTEADIDATGHRYDTPMYIWSDDNSLVTATAVCKNDPGHIVSEQKETASEVTKPATCEEPGNKKFTAEFENELFTVQTKDVAISAIGHDWDAPTYTWAEDNSKVTAKRVCRNDSSHVETETAEAASEVTKPATCLEKGETTYTAEFENEAFTKQTKTLDNIDALGHDWDTPTYTWAEDNSKVTAKRICKNESSHVETETVDTASAVTKPATCLEKGATTYTAEFENKAFAKQTKTLEDVDALGHDWDAPTYTWAEDNSKVSAKRVCKNDPSHVETETVDTASEVTKPATCLVKGETTYTAEFENKAFPKQTKTLDNIDALGHDWDAPTYTWAEDNSKVTAKRICKNESSHVETETVDTASAVTKPATCLEKGETTYTAEFENKAFSKQTKTLEDVDALGHDWDAPTYTWAEDNSKVSAKRVCKNDPSHVETEEKETSSEVTKPAGCEEKGETTYTAEFENKAFPKQTKTIANIDAIGHDYGEWKDFDDTYHQRACSHDASHVENEEHAWDEGVVVKESTMDEEGVMAYKCTVCGHEKTDPIERLAPEDQMGEDGTPLGPGASAEAAEKAITGMKSDKDPAGSQFVPLILRSTKQTTKSAKLVWKQQKKAVKYVLYGNRCGRKNRMKRIKSISAGRGYITLRKAVKKIRKATSYKFIMVALDKNNRVVSTSKLIHIVTKGGRMCNYKSLTTKAKDNKVALKAGQSFRIGAKCIKQSAKLKVSIHVNKRYQSMDKKIAVVTSKGVIKAKAKGTTYVYAYAQSGVYKKIKVTVR